MNCDAIICTEHHTFCDKPSTKVLEDDHGITFACEKHSSVRSLYHPRHERLPDGSVVRKDCDHRGGK